MNQSALLIFCLILLTLSGAQGIPLSRTTRCTCISISTRSVNPGSLAKLEVIPASQSCPRVEIIATMKSGEKRCLNLESKIVKNVLKALSNKQRLKSSSTQSKA
ncbi:C-X-C motif chemokine 10 [Sturnira hondurensis]|uniref:C-X-C motif chemokine 10 n=1 Tax=Sturnira hondurensis TaxID=192404 RepID=UPI00187AF2A2|nr:C-X-C motif chemokine 10 [Sturnira hondurensis]